jgi:hypothetical protein
MQLALIEKATVVSKGDDRSLEAIQVRGTELLKACKKSMIADNQIKMRSLLNELIDHRLVLNIKDKETGNEVFWLPFDKQRLEAIATGNEFN